MKITISDFILLVNETQNAFTHVVLIFVKKV
jgi:hypothetical protein